MADEIPNANVIRVMKDGPRWCALIGPDPQRGLVEFADTPQMAVWVLMVRAKASGWVFDETWKPR